MTRGQLYSQIILELGLNSQDRRVHPLSVFMAADTVRGALIPPYVEKHGDDSLSLFCMETVLPVKFDSSRGLKYVSLPFQILGLADNKGLFSVGPTMDDESAYIGIKNGMTSVYSNLEAGGAAGNTLYWLSGTRINFRYLPAGVENVLVKAIPSLSDLIDDNEQVPQPLEFNRLVIDGTKQAILPQVAEDKTIDTRQGA